MRVDEPVHTDPEPEPAPDPNVSLYSLIVDEGAGAPLAAAAGDVAGGADGYGATTQVATVVAYHLLRLGEVHRELLTVELAELDGGEDSRGVYRGASPELRRWLDSLRTGEPVAGARPSIEPATRMAPVGMWFRHQPDDLVSAAVNVARTTHLDAASVVVAAAVAGAVAGACYAMCGRDLVHGAAETADRAVVMTSAEPYRYADVPAATEVPARLRRMAAMVGDDPVVLGSAIAAGGPVHAALAALVLAADPWAAPERLITAGAKGGGSEAGAIVGAVVGARVGLRRWPWKVPNETWFAEIGRRLVEHHQEVEDLPVPYAVEERMGR